MRGVERLHCISSHIPTVRLHRQKVRDLPNCADFLSIEPIGELEKTHELSCLFTVDKLVLAGT